MFHDWKIGDKQGPVIFPKGEVVYQTKGVVVEPIYKATDGKCFILATDLSGEDVIDVNGRRYIAIDGRKFVELSGRQVMVESDNDKLLEVYTNPINGYCYRQDGM